MGGRARVAFQELRSLGPLLKLLHPGSRLGGGLGDLAGLPVNGLLVLPEELADKARVDKDSSAVGGMEEVDEEDELEEEIEGEPKRERREKERISTSNRERDNGGGGSNQKRSQSEKNSRRLKKE